MIFNDSREERYLYLVLCFTVEIFPGVFEIIISVSKANCRTAQTSNDLPCILLMILLGIGLLYVLK